MMQPLAIRTISRPHGFGVDVLFLLGSEFLAAEVEKDRNPPSASRAGVSLGLPAPRQREYGHPT